MVLQHGITGITKITSITRIISVTRITSITRITWSCAWSRKSMIAWKGLIWDNREVRAGRPAVIAALLSRAGGELGR